MTVWPTNDPALGRRNHSERSAQRATSRQKSERRDDVAGGVDSRLPHHPDDTEISEGDGGARQRRAFAQGSSQTGTETGSRYLSLGHGGDRFSDRASVDQMDGAGIRRSAGQIAAAAVLDFVESEGPSEPGPFHHRRRSLRKSGTATERCLLNFSGGTLGRCSGPGFSQHVEVPAARRWQYPNHHGGTGHGHRAVPGFPPGTAGDWRKGKELALLRIAASALQLFLPRRAGQYERTDFDSLRLRLVTGSSGKSYVQHKMLENAAEIWKWIDSEDAHFFVCGDARRMAKDVDAALRKIIEGKAAKAKRRPTNTSRG